MCQMLCGNASIHDGEPEKTGSSRREFLAVGASALGAAATFSAPTPAQALGPQEREEMPRETGTTGRRYLIKGGAVLSMDPNVGDFAQGDVLIEGKRIVAVGPNLHAPDATIIHAAGMIVMPGFVDTHHHQYQTALRSFLSDGLLFNDGLPHGQKNYLDYIHFRITTRLQAAGRLPRRARLVAQPAGRWGNHGRRHVAGGPFSRSTPMQSSEGFRKRAAGRSSCTHRGRAPATSSRMISSGSGAGISPRPTSS